MLKITNNTYPNADKFPSGTKCFWIIDCYGHLKLVSIGNETIMTKGQVYAQNGNLLAGKKEPAKIGVVASFKKNGWILEVKPI